MNSWDEAVASGADVYANSKRQMDPTMRPPEQFVEAILEAFALSALGPTGPAALKDWVEGKMVLVPREPTPEMVATGAANIPPWWSSAMQGSKDFGNARKAARSCWRGMVEAASPAAPDGETK